MNDDECILNYFLFKFDDIVIRDYSCSNSCVGYILTEIKGQLLITKVNLNNKFRVPNTHYLALLREYQLSKESIKILKINKE